MILYHGTSNKRANLILSSGIVKKDVERYYTYENNGSKASSNGFVYLSNEIMWAYKFAFSHSHSDKEYCGCIFKFFIPSDLLMPDEDELKEIPNHVINCYPNRLTASLLECKSCRVDFDVYLHTYKAESCMVDVKDECELLKNAARDYKYTTENYTDKQKDFINNLQWVKC